MQENVPILSAHTPFTPASSRNRAPLSNTASCKGENVPYVSHTTTEALQLWLVLPRNRILVVLHFH